MRNVFRCYIIWLKAVMCIMFFTFWPALCEFLVNKHLFEPCKHYSKCTLSWAMQSYRYTMQTQLYAPKNYKSMYGAWMDMNGCELICESMNTCKYSKKMNSTNVHMMFWYTFNSHFPYLLLHWGIRLCYQSYNNMHILIMFKPENKIEDVRIN